MGLFDGIFGGVNSIISGVLGLLYNVTAALTQSLTNGKSLLGTLQAVLFPFFLTNNPLPNGFPWGTRTSTNTSPYTQSPNTGIIRTYDFTISRGMLAPDGYQKPVLLVNGAFPGPTIEANWGDTIQVTVHNNITKDSTGDAEGTALHWHGFLQTATPWEDGVPGVDQCPIAPGKSYTYQFKAELYGTTWYHSHYRSVQTLRQPHLLFSLIRQRMGGRTIANLLDLQCSILWRCYRPNDHLRPQPEEL